MKLAKEQAIREDLMKAVPQNLQVNIASMFPKFTGLGVAKKNRSRIELLNKHSELIAEIVEKGELLRMITTGTVNLWWETSVMGFWAHLINRTLIILTNKRLLLIHLSGKKAESYVKQVPLAAIKKFSSGLFSSVIKFGKGRMTLTGIPRAERKQFADLFKKNKEAKGGVQHLCAKCFSLHAKHVLRCSQCGAEFKNPKTAALKSLILPGLGDYYLGHKTLAVLEMLGSVITWIIALSLIVGGLENGDVIGGVVWGIILIVMAHGFDAALTHAQAQKGLMAIDGQLGGRDAGFQRGER